MFIIAAIFLIFLFGPRAKFEPVKLSQGYPPLSISNVDSVIDSIESQVLDIKPGNAAEIVWFDSVKTKTEYSVVYLHGFSASHEEGMPLHREFAKRYGCNLYLARLKEHGRTDQDAFIDLTPQEFLESAEFAVEVGKAIGDKVILLNCSTGSTTGLYLAAHEPRIAATFNYSPNIDIAGDMDALLVGPWGRQMAQYTFGGNYNIIDYSEEQAKYWNNKYHINGLIALKSLIEEVMTRNTFERITQPTFLGYYYQNDLEQDPIVSVKRMLDFYDQISTPDSLKRKIAFPNGRHVMTSHVVPSDATKRLQKETYKFAEQIMGLKPILTE